MGSSPNWSFEFVPTPAQWNQQFANKQDELNLSQQTIIALQAGAGAADGIATLDSTGKVPTSQLPSTEGDVTGPASSIDGHVAVFNGATGKTIEDGGFVPVNRAGDTMTGELIVSKAAGTQISAIATGSSNGGAALNASNGFSATAPIYSFQGNVTTGIGNPASNVITAINAGVESWRVDANGNLLIGLTSQLANGDAQFCNVQNAGATGEVGGAEGLFQFSNDNSCAFLGFFKNRETTKGSGQVAVQNHTNGNDGDDVGEIGFHASDGTNYVKTGYFTGTVQGPVSTGVVPMGYEWGATGTSGTLKERMRLTPDGALLIGINALHDPFDEEPKLFVEGAVIIEAGASTDGFDHLILQTTDTGINKPALIFGQGPAANQWKISLADGSTDTGTIQINATKIDLSPGAVFIGSPTTTATAANAFIDTTTTPAGQLKRSTSSKRYKTNIRDYDKGLDAISKLRPVYYHGINDGDKEFAGLIAEEVHDAGLTEFVVYNSDSQPDALGYANMVALLIKAVQEQQEQIKDLQAKLAASTPAK